jgi:hypothetical protein
MFGLGLRSGHHPSLDQLISSQLNQVGVPFVVGRRGAGGAEWRCVDFELGRSARGACGCVRCGVRGRAGGVLSVIAWLRKLSRLVSQLCIGVW